MSKLEIILTEQLSRGKEVRETRGQAKDGLIWWDEAPLGCEGLPCPHCNIQRVERKWVCRLGLPTNFPFRTFCPDCKHEVGPDWKCPHCYRIFSSLSELLVMAKDGWSQSSIEYLRTLLELPKPSVDQNLEPRSNNENL